MVIRGLISGFLLLPYFSGIVSHPRDLQVSKNVVSVSLSSSHLLFIIGLIRDLLVSFVDSLMGLETLMLTKCF